MNGQWLTQEIPLVPGWNAVYLTVQPEPVRCDQQFDGLPVNSVWKWHKRFASVEFDADPATPLPDDPHWLNWLPPDHPEYFLANLFELQGGSAYLIKVDETAAPFVWSVKGKPAEPNNDWSEDDLNLVGFNVNPDQPPTFLDFFDYAPTIPVFQQQEGKILHIQSDGVTERVRLPAIERLAAGKAYWVKSLEHTTFSGPIVVSSEQGDGLEYELAKSEAVLTLSNHSPTSQVTVTLECVSSEMPPPGQPEMAGEALLSRRMIDLSIPKIGWEPFDAPINETLEPGETRTLRLAVRWPDLAPYTPVGTNGATYQAIIKVTESTGTMKLMIPVTVELP